MGFFQVNQKKLYVHILKLYRVYFADYWVLTCFDVSCSFFFIECKIARMGPQLLYFLLFDISLVLDRFSRLLDMVSLENPRARRFLDWNQQWKQVHIFLCRNERLENSFLLWSCIYHGAFFGRTDDWISDLAWYGPNGYHIVLIASSFLILDHNKTLEIFLA